MAELLGAIDTDYRSPKITDDHIQQSTAVRATEMMNLQSQMMTRGQQADTAAANTASLIQSRIDQSNLASRQADLATYKAGVEADRTYNLIDMNLRSSEREDMKMPYVLEGLAAQNWINHTIAEGNELTNEYDNATMGARVEGAALDAKNKLASLNGKRAETQRAKAQSDRETADAVVWTEVMNDLDAGVDIDTLNPIFTSKKFNTQYTELKRSEHEEIDYKAAVAAKMQDSKDQTERIGKLSHSQRQAWDIAPDDAARAGVMHGSEKTNQAKEDLRAIGVAGKLAWSHLANNRDPANPTTIPTVDLIKDGILTADGIMVANKAMQTSQMAETRRFTAASIAARAKPPLSATAQAAFDMEKENDYVLAMIKEKNPASADEAYPAGKRNYTTEEARVDYHSRRGGLTMGTRGGIDVRPESQASWETARENIRDGSLPEGIATVKDARYVNDITQVLHAFDQNIRRDGDGNLRLPPSSGAFASYKSGGTPVKNNDIDIKSIGEGWFGGSRPAGSDVLKPGVEPSGMELGDVVDTVTNFFVGKDPKLDVTRVQTGWLGTPGESEKHLRHAGSTTEAVAWYKGRLSALGVEVDKPGELFRNFRPSPESLEMFGMTLPPAGEGGDRLWVWNEKISNQLNQKWTSIPKTKMTNAPAVAAGEKKFRSSSNPADRVAPKYREMTRSELIQAVNSSKGGSGVNLKWSETWVEGVDFRRDGVRMERAGTQSRAASQRQSRGTRKRN